MKKMNKKGFTLIELLAVIVILAIVAAVSMTVIVPMISGKSNEAAETSVKEINKQIANACASSGASEAYGTFGTETDSADTIAACSKSTGCTLEYGDATKASTFVKNLNISGDMPSYVKVVVKRCQVNSSCYHYTEGQFEGLKVETDANGKVTSSKGTCK